MEKFDAHIAQAAAACLDNEVPFCLYRLPGKDSETVFFSNPYKYRSAGSRCFLIGMWNRPAATLIHIYDEWDAEETLQHLPLSSLSQPSSVKPWKKSTREKTYLGKLERLVENLSKGRADKVVVSRTKAVKRSLTGNEIISIAQNVFNAFPGSFRHVYYTPLTGAWMGATPELLLDYNDITGELHTMALAGTRDSRDNGEPWSGKDVAEQKIVSDFIARALEEKGFNVNLSQPYTLATGNLEHIATDIEALYLGGNLKPSVERVLDILNPTPALCGTPKPYALEAIADFEEHLRLCYGGIIGERNGPFTRAYVNLRCVNFNSRRLCFYAGGGILAQSQPSAEWKETERKIHSVSRFFDPTDQD